MPKGAEAKIGVEVEPLVSRGGVDDVATLGFLHVDDDVETVTEEPTWQDGQHF